MSWVKKRRKPTATKMIKSASRVYDSTDNKIDDNIKNQNQSNQIQPSQKNQNPIPSSKQKIVMMKNHYIHEINGKRVQLTSDDIWVDIKTRIISDAPSMIPLIYLPVVHLKGKASILCNGKEIYITDDFWKQPINDCMYMVLKEFTQVILGFRVQQDIKVVDLPVREHIAKVEVGMILTKVQNMLADTLLLQYPTSIGISRNLVNPSHRLLSSIYESFGGYTDKGLDRNREFIRYIEAEDVLGDFIRRWAEMSLNPIIEQLMTGYKSCRSSATSSYVDIYFNISPSSTSYASKFVNTVYVPRGNFLIDIPAELIEKMDNQVQNQEDEKRKKKESEYMEMMYGQSQQNNSQQPQQSQQQPDNQSQQQSQNDQDIDMDQDDSMDQSQGDNIEQDNGSGQDNGASQDDDAGRDDGADQDNGSGQDGFDMSDLSDDLDGCDGDSEGDVDMQATAFGSGGGGANYDIGDLGNNIQSDQSWNSEYKSIERMSESQIQNFYDSMDMNDMINFNKALRKLKEEGKEEGSLDKMNELNDILNNILNNTSELPKEVQESLMKYMEDNKMLQPTNEEMDEEIELNDSESIYDQLETDYASEYNSLLNEDHSTMEQEVYKDIILNTQRFLDESSISYGKDGFGSRATEIYNDLYKVSNVWWKKAQSMIMGYVPDVNSSYRRPNKKFAMSEFILPSQCEKSQSFEVDRLRVFLDSSGSMTSDDFKIFKSLIKSSQKYFPNDTTAYEFNTTLTPMKCVRGKIIGSPAHSGGTEINCVLDFILKQPDKDKALNILVTDGGFNWRNLITYMKKDDKLSKFLFILTTGDKDYTEATKTINAKRLKVLHITASGKSDTLRWR